MAAGAGRSVRRELVTTLEGQSAHQLQAAFGCRVQTMGAVGQLALEASDFGEEDIDRDILQMLLNVDYSSAVSAQAVSQLQELQHVHCQQLMPSAPQHLQQHNRCPITLQTHDAFASGYNALPFKLSTMPSADTDHSSDFSHVHSPIDSPLTAQHAVPQLQQQYCPADSALRRPQSSNPGRSLPGNLPASEQQDKWGVSGWQALIHSEHLVTGLGPVGTMPDSAFPDPMYAAAPAACDQYYYTPAAGAAAAAAGAPAPNLAAAPAAAISDVYMPNDSTSLPKQHQQQQQVITPASTAGDAPSAAANTSDGSSKRGRRSDSRANNNNNRKRQRLPPPGERALESLQHKYTSVTEENAALKAQLSALQSDKNELVDRMTGLTQKWQATVAEVARLHRDNLALLERLSAVDPRFGGY